LSDRRSGIHATHCSRSIALNREKPNVNRQLVA
jgi:hypothetical protein